VRAYFDRMSGASESRPRFAALMQGRAPRCFRCSGRVRFDRFARSVKRLVLALEEFHTLGIGFVYCSRKGPKKRMSEQEKIGV
jgi:hypothetical protein